MPSCQWCNDSFGHRPECPVLEVDVLRHERNRYREALEQIRDFPHAPDAWIVAAMALEPDDYTPEARKAQGLTF